MPANSNSLSGIREPTFWSFEEPTAKDCDAEPKMLSETPAPSLLCRRERSVHRSGRSEPSGGCLLSAVEQEIRRSNRALVTTPARVISTNGERREY